MRLVSRAAGLPAALVVASLCSAQTANHRAATQANEAGPASGLPAPEAPGVLIAGPFDVETPAYDDRCLGVEEAWGHYWVTGGGHTTTGWNRMIHQYDHDGNYIASFPQVTNSTGWGGRDMEADEGAGLLWVGSDNGEVSEYIHVAGSLIWLGMYSIPIPQTIRALCRDPGTGHFYTKSFTSSFYEFDLAGTVHNAIASGPPSAFGFGWDRISGTIWATDQGPSVTEITTLCVPTGEAFGPTFGLAQGGADVYEDSRNPGHLSIVVLGQGTPDSIGVYDLDVPTSLCPAPVIYCTYTDSNTATACGYMQCPSSSGCTARITTSDPQDCPVSGASDYQVLFTGAEVNKPAIIFFGLQGRAFIPFSSGTLCVQPPLKRTAPGSTGTTGAPCTGSHAITINDPAGVNYMPGTPVNFQGWSRDPWAPAGTDLSDAVEVIYGAGTAPDLDLPPGVDLYTAAGSANLNLPAGFFGVGSEPFVGSVSLAGSPLETRGPFELGTTDTIVERVSEARFYPAPSVQRVFVDMVELSLASTTPITVMFNGAPEDWDVFVELSPVRPGSEGTLQFLRTTPTGGTFHARLPVVPLFRFVRGGTERTLEPGEVVLEGSNGAWDSLSTCTAFDLDVPHLNLGFCMGIDVASSLLGLSLQPAATDPNRPPATVDPGATVDPNVGSLGRFAVISNGAFVGAGAVIGPWAFIGPHAVISDYALIGENAIIESSTSVGVAACVDGYTHVLPGAVISDGAVVGRNGTIQDGAAVGPNSRIGDDAMVELGVQVGRQVECGASVVLGAYSVVSDGARIADWAVLGPGTVLTEDIIECVHPGGGTSVGTAGQCNLLGGAIPAHVPNRNHWLTKPDSKKKAFPIDPQNLPPALANLANDINAAGVAPQSNGGTAPNYVKDTNDCDDFAEKLEKALQKAGYSATFTIVWTLDTDRSWWQTWKPHFKVGHCLTDVRHEGKIIWIEAQWTAPAGIGVNLDDNKDGRVTHASGKGTKATDGKLRVEVYESREAAEKERGALD